MREMIASKTPWINVYPAEWKQVPLHALFSEYKNKNKEGAEQNLLSLSYGNIVRKDINTNEGLLPESFNGYNIIDDGDIVLRLTDLQNDHRSLRTGLATERGIITSAYVTLRKKTPLSSKYYHYLLHTFDIMKVFYTMGEGIRQSLGYDELAYVVVPQPPLPEQHAIVSYLDEKCAAIDEAIERHEKIIDKLEEYKKAATIKAVTKGIRGNAIDDSGEEWLGSIPKHWSVKRNWALFKETNERGNDALPILTVSINSGISDRELSDDESERVFVRSEDRSKYKRVQPGDIAYNMMRAWQGAFGAARVEGMVSPAYITARPIVKMDTRYFEYLMRTNFAAKEFEKYSRGITDFRLRLYYPEFRNIRVCVPPIEEQSEIADYLDT
ncbi:MAG: restriction endonuclease subunit S, partial [Eubacterium sp.]|nr:restriction endonuclease subunit S [Eubacterium sp.]